jgi:hypothetical protein
MDKVRLKEAGSFLDLTGRRVQQLVREKVIPRSVRGLYDLRRCVVSYIRFLRGTDQSQDLQQIKARNLAQKTKKLEVETAQLEQSLILKTELERLLQGHVTAAEMSFAHLPAHLSHILVQLEQPLDQKLISIIIDYAIKDIIRHDLAGVPRPKTETVEPWQIELLKLGLIAPNSDGEIIESRSSFPFKRRVKAADLIRHWEGLNKTRGGISDEKKESGNPNGDQKGMDS